MKKALTNSLALLIAMVVLQGCSPVKFDTSFKPTDKVNTEETPPKECDHCDENPGSCCFLQTHEQQVRQSTGKLDILFVTDTSGSLNEERLAVAEGIKNFVSKLPPNIDFNIGVMLAHGSTSSHSGKLYKANTEPLVLKSSQLSIDSIKEHLKTKLVNVADDWDSDGGEEGFYSTTEALKAGNLETIKSAGIFRDDAALAIVYVADENDICARYPVGVTRNVDYDGLELPAFARDCANVTHESVYNQLKALKGNLPLTVGAVIYTGATVIPNIPKGENEIGYGYKEIVGLNNGVLVNIGGNDITNGLAAIGAKTASSIMYKLDFKLKYGPIDPASVEVKVNGKVVPHTYVKETNTVHINEADAVAGATVEIKYCLESNEVPFDDGDNF